MAAAAAPWRDLARGYPVLVNSKDEILQLLLPKLTYTEFKLIFTFLREPAGSWVCITEEQLAELAGVTVTAIEDAKRSLERMGLIEFRKTSIHVGRRADRRNREYRVVPESLEPDLLKAMPDLGPRRRWSLRLGSGGDR